MRVEDFLRTSARRLPDKEALTAGGRRFAYGELDRLSDRLAAALASRGLKRGERVVLFMDNAWETVVAIFAVLKAGGVFCPVNPSTKAAKLAFILTDSEAAAILTLARLVPVAAEAMAGAPSVRFALAAGGSPAGFDDFEAAIADAPFGPLAFAGIEIDLAMLVYTSGSTGFPKGVMMTHQNVDAAATSITTYLENTEADVILNVLPVSFDYGLYQVLMAMKVGARLVLEKSFAFPRAVLDKAIAERVTGLPLVPTMASLILQMKDIAPGQFPDLRYVTNTAAALPPAHIRALRDLFAGATLYSMYGLTECKRCTYLPPAELDRRPGSVGVAIPGTEAFVVGEDGKEVPRGETGELVIRGPHVMKGYWRNEAATAKALRQGPFPWEKVLYTGDLFRRDAEGFLYFVARKDDIIKTRGEKVSPKEVETALYALDGIAAAAVIGVPDGVLGMALKAVVALRPGAALSERDVIRHCAQSLEDFMVPKLVEFRDTLPTSENGKVDRRQIAEEMEAAR